MWITPEKEKIAADARAQPNHSAWYKRPWRRTRGVFELASAYWAAPTKFIILERRHDILRFTLSAITEARRFIQPCAHFFFVSVVMILYVFERLNLALQLLLIRRKRIKLERQVSHLLALNRKLSLTYASRKKPLKKIK